MDVLIVDAVPQYHILRLSDLVAYNQVNKDIFPPLEEDLDFPLSLSKEAGPSGQIPLPSQIYENSMIHVRTSYQS